MNTKRGFLGATDFPPWPPPVPFPTPPPDPLPPLTELTELPLDNGPVINEPPPDTKTEVPLPPPATGPNPPGICDPEPLH